ncbi:antigen peptide transporter 2-like [Leptodactylus fuscus]|uniref:antigen peptide transporter 2 n=1 Tax=Leptodactylus fuscus TaxID=238119 RepID=UPI003F4F3A5E
MSKTVSLCFPVLIFLLDSSLSWVTSGLIYKHYPAYYLGSVWLVYLSKAPILLLVANNLPRPQWIPSGRLYVLTLCLVPPLHQTLRFSLSSQAPELLSGFVCSLLYHLPPTLSCLLWDLASLVLSPKQISAGNGERNKQDKKNFIRLIKYSKDDWLPLCLAFTFLTLALTLEMSIPYYMGRVIDILSNNYKETEFLAAIFFMAFFSITSSFSAGCRGGFFIFCFSRLTRRLRIFLFRALVKQDIAFFETTKTGDLLSRLTSDTTVVSQSIARNVNITLRTLVKCIGHYAFMISLSWRLTLLTGLIIPFISFTQSLYNKYHQDLVRKVQDSIASSSDIAKEIVESAKTVQSFAAEDEEVQRYEDALKKTHELQTRRDMVRAVHLLAIRVINLFGQVLMLWFGHTLIQRGEISTGEMVSFILYQMETGDNVMGVIHMLSEITHSAGAASKVFQYLDREPQVSTSGSLSPDNLRGSFEFRNVTFSYPSRPDVPALQDVSFHLPSGKVTALVGPSGGGKTTCVSLLERFYEPQSGEILLDGRAIADYKHQYLHTKVALVAQEPVLFAGTVKENISYGLHEKSEEQIATAVKQAKAEKFIRDMEKGYDTDVGNSGAQLGSSQKQRIALARALARKPKLLILDEASSFLDVETEHEIQQSVQNIPGLALLIIAHRLRTVQTADQILVLEGGRVVERGSHEELVQKKGAYCKLLQNGN